MRIWDTLFLITNAMLLAALTLIVWWLWEELLPITKWTCAAIMLNCCLNIWDCYRQYKINSLVQEVKQELAESKRELEQMRQEIKG